MLQKRLVMDMSNFSTLETAFANIKKATGLHGTNEIIEKLLTREAGYVEILDNVNYTKIKIKEYNNKNKDMEEKLNILTMIKTEGINPAKVLGIEVTKKSREIEIMGEKLRRITGVYKKVTVWCNKLSNILRQYTNKSDTSFFATSFNEDVKIKPVENLSVEIINLKNEVSIILQSFRSDVMTI